MESAAPAALPLPGGYGSYSYERRTPARPAAWESDVLVPLAQSGIFGLLAGLVSVAGPIWFDVPWWAPLPITVGVTALAWWLISNDHRQALWVIEQMSNQDLDHDGSVGKPAAPAPPIGLEITHRSESGQLTRMLRFELPQGVSEADFIEFCRGVTLESRSLAENVWTGRGKRFSRSKYSELLDTLTQAEIIRWKNAQAPAQGRELTAAGYQSLLKYARTHAHAPSGAANYEYIEGVG